MKINVGDLVTDAELKTLPDHTKVTYRGYSAINGSIIDGRFVYEKKPIDGRLYEIRELPGFNINIGDTIRWEKTHTLPVGAILKSTYGSLYFVTKLGLACKVNHKYCLRAWTELLSSYASAATIIYLPESK